MARAELDAVASMDWMELRHYAASALRVCTHRWVKQTPANGPAFSFPRCGRYALIQPDPFDEGTWLVWLHVWGVPLDRECANCHKSKCHLIPCAGACSAARRVYYCSRECADWHHAQHAPVCTEQYPGAEYWRLEEKRGAQSTLHRRYWP